jgi:hypothetical protein
LAPALNGSGYTNGTYTNIALSGGTGTGATANLTVSGGAVTASALVRGGQFYLVGDVLSCALIGAGTLPLLCLLLPLPRVDCYAC